MVSDDMTHFVTKHEKLRERSIIARSRSRVNRSDMNSSAIDVSISQQTIRTSGVNHPWMCSRCFKALSIRSCNVSWTFSFSRDRIFKTCLICMDLDLASNLDQA